MNEELSIADEFASAMDGDGAIVGDDFAALDSLIGDSAAAAAVERRIAEGAPILTPKPQGPLVFRGWQVDSGQVFGPANGETTITIRPQCRFRCEKIMATDDAANAGTGTRILSVTVGNKVQKVGPLGNGTLTKFFAAQALANGISFDTADPWAEIQIRVRFVQQGNFEITLFGTAADHE